MQDAGYLQARGIVGTYSSRKPPRHRNNSYPARPGDTARPDGALTLPAPTPPNQPLRTPCGKPRKETRAPAPSHPAGTLIHPAQQAGASVPLTRSGPEAPRPRSQLLLPARCPTPSRQPDLQWQRRWEGRQNCCWSTRWCSGCAGNRPAGAQAPAAPPARSRRTRSPTLRSG